MATCICCGRREYYRFSIEPGRWFDRISRAFLYRPAVCMLVAMMVGGYIAYFASGLFRMGLSCVVSAILLSFLAIKTGHIREEISIGLAVAGFSMSFIGFCFIRQRLLLRLEPIRYQGEASVVSNNSTDEGYKNLILELKTGEKVIWLTDMQFDYGESLEISGSLEPIRSKGNPGDMDVREYYRRMGIVRSLQRPSYHSLGDSCVSPIILGYRIGDSLSRACYLKWIELTDEETAMLLAAMIVGDDSHLTSSVKEDFRESNLAHLLVVSGAHVGYFAGTIIMLSSVVLAGRKKRMIVLMALLVFFGFVSGWSGPVARSIFSYILVCLLSDGKHCVDRISVCSSSAILIILFDPYSMFSSGMLLSFGATFSILMFRESVEKGLKTYFRWLPVELCRSVACFASAQLGMVPVMLTMGNSFSVRGLLVVILAGFPAETICCLGLPLTVLSLLIPLSSAGKLLFVPIRGLTLFLAKLAEIGAGKEVSRFSLRYLPGCMIGSAVCIVLVILVRSGFRRNVLLTLVCVLLGLSLTLPDPYSKKSRVYFLNVGQGDCALILHDHFSVLVDGGRKGSGEKIEKIMEYLGIGSIDIAFATHLDVDHIGGLLELYEIGRIDRLYTSFWSESSEMQQLRSSCPYLTSEVGILSMGESVVIDDDLRFDVLWPENPINGGNDDSLVILMRLYETEVLFSGDISGETEQRIEGKVPYSLDVLKVAHHGSKFSTSEEFLKKEKIDAAVISVGYNLYGHPSSETLARLSEAEIPYFRTDEGGCVLLSVSEETWEMDYYFA